MKGDLDRCLDAAFDGYLSKPIRAAELDKAMVAIASGGMGPVRVTHAGGFDQSFALEQAGGDKCLLRDLVELGNQAPGQFQRVQDGIDHGDCQSTVRTS